MQNLILTPIAVPELVDLIASEVEARIQKQEIKEPPKDRIGLKEVVEMTSLSTSALYKLTMEGKIPYEKCGKRLVFSRQELEKWIGNRTKRIQTSEEIVAKQLQRTAKRLLR
jgi:excisionase family DNA binding protein